MSGATTLTAGTASTTTTTGTLVITGGLGVSGDINATNLGGTLTTAAQTNITSVGTLTSLTMAGAISGVTTLGVSGIVTLTNATESTTTGTGALVITGGLGVGGAIRSNSLLAINGALSGVTTLGASGIVTLTNATASTTTGTGALVITGGLGVGSAIYSAGSINSGSSFIGEGLSINGVSVLGNLSGSRLRIVESGAVMYMQCGLSATTGSASDLFIGNYIETTTVSARKIIFKADGKVGFGTNAPTHQLEINEASGNCLRLTNNDPDGSATNYADFLVSATGDLTIDPTGTYTYIDSSLIIDQTDAYALVVRKNNVGGDVFSVNTSTSVVDITGSLTLSGNATFTNYNITKITDINLTAQSNTVFYPVAIYDELIGTYGSYPAINFQITGISLIGGNSYNENTLIGYARGGGASDHNELFNVSIRNFVETEFRFLGLYDGTQDFQNGFVVYLRGGYGYTIQADGHATVTAGTIGSALTINDSVFATKNSSFVDQTGTSTNIVLMQSLLVVSGTFSNLPQYNLKSNMANSTFIVNGIGKSHSTYNQAEFAYNHIGDGNSSNYGFLGMYGHANVLCWNGLDCVGIGKTPSTDTTSTSTTTGALTITGGLGLSGSMFMDGTLNVNNTCNMGDLTGSNGRLRILDTSSVMYLQVGTSNTAGSSADLFIGNIGQAVASSDRKIMFKADGKVGINTGSPATGLHIKQLVTDDSGGDLTSIDQSAIIIERNGNTDKWAIGMNSSSSLNFYYGTAEKGWIANGTSVSAIDFTGQHRSSTNNTNINNNINNYIGLIVYSTGTYNNLNGSNIYINEALPEVELTNLAQDKRVFGVISNREDENSNRHYEQGSFVSVFEKIEGDERLIINSLGEGMVWVCNKNGNLENGDYITSSSVVGYGQIQNDDLLHNYTVAKITQNCDFSTPERYVNSSGAIITQAEYTADIVNNYKCNFVGCTYHCG